MWLIKRQSELQVRDPRAATAPRTASVMGRRYTQWNADKAIMNGLYSNVYVYACARARAQDVSTLPIRVGPDPDRPKDFNPDHPIAKLLGPMPGGPTMNISARKLLAWSSIQLDVAGRFAWEIAEPEAHRQDGVPFEFWPLASGMLHPIPSHGGGNWFNGFEYEAHASRIRLSNSQVMYYWRPKGDDFREPESLLEAAKLNVSVAVMQDKYDHAFLQNDARPAAVVVHEAFSEKEERDGFRRQFLDSHAGPDNAGKMAFVETSVDGAVPSESLLIQNLGLSQRDAEFIERYENQIRAICVAFATPLSRLADSSRRTYANAERETLNYWRNAVVPQAVEMAEAINTTIMPMLGDTENVVWFDTSLIPELEPPTRFSVGDIPALIQAKAITVNEARHSVFLEPIEGGDEMATDPEPTPEPAAFEEDPERSIDWSQQAQEIYPSWARTMAIIHDQVVDSLHRRASGKRGRQSAELPASTLLEEDYWFPRMANTFAVAVDSLYASVAAGLRANGVENFNKPGSAEAKAWCDNTSAVTAQALIEVYTTDLNKITVEDASYWDRQPQVSLDDVRSLVNAAVEAANPRHVSAELVGATARALVSGEMTVEAALAEVGVKREATQDIVVNVQVDSPSGGSIRKTVERDEHGTIIGVVETVEH